MAKRLEAIGDTLLRDLRGVRTTGSTAAAADGMARARVEAARPS